LGENHRPPVPPAGTIWERLEGMQRSLTVHGFSQETMEALREQNRVEDSHVHDMELEAIFKDLIKGQRQP